MTLSIEKCREILGSNSTNMSNQQIEELRDYLKSTAVTFIRHFKEIQKLLNNHSKIFIDIENGFTLSDIEELIIVQTRPNQIISIKSCHIKEVFING